MLSCICTPFPTPEFNFETASHNTAQASLTLTILLFQSPKYYKCFVTGICYETCPVQSFEAHQSYRNRTTDIEQFQLGFNAITSTEILNCIQIIISECYSVRRTDLGLLKQSSEHKLLF